MSPVRSYQPSFYRLTDGNTSVCLAADFSRSRAAENRTGSDRTGFGRTGSNRTGSDRTGSDRTGFGRTSAVRISGTSLYNQVAWWSGEKDECEEGECFRMKDLASALEVEDSLESDVLQVNRDQDRDRDLKGVE